jgi:hypothetical protein
MNEKQAQLEWEARAGKIAGAFAFLASALLVSGIVYRINALPHNADNARDFLIGVSTHKGAFVVSGVLGALAMLALIPPLAYLYRATRFRRPQLPPVALVLAIAGPILFAVVQVWFQIKQADAATIFVNGTVKTAKHAEDVLRDETGVVRWLALTASMSIGLSIILISINAMRAGLLSRFMGILGVILGGLTVLSPVAAPVLQLFWLTAIGVLFINRWPGAGRGPAWESGEPEPWPTAQDRYAEVRAAQEPGEAEPGEAEPATAVAENPRSRKRKKKRR